MENSSLFCEDFLRISKLISFLYYDETKTSVIGEENIQGSSLCHLSKTEQVINSNEISNAIHNWVAVCWAELGIQIQNLHFD